jgi:hypothetical protein
MLDVMFSLSKQLCRLVVLNGLVARQNCFDKRSMTGLQFPEYPCNSHKVPASSGHFW